VSQTGMLVLFDGAAEPGVVPQQETFWGNYFRKYPRDLDETCPAPWVRRMLEHKHKGIEPLGRKLLLLLLLFLFLFLLSLLLQFLSLLCLFCFVGIVVVVVVEVVVVVFTVVVAVVAVFMSCSYSIGC
ncbi:unnamed protein product, partial [Polarella glacialis]